MNKRTQALFFLSALPLMALCLAGCNWPPPPTSRTVTTDEADYLHIIRIDGCQYLESGSPGWHSYAITHKGNCDNPIHKHAP